MSVQQTHCFGFAGYPGAGKTTAMDILSDRLNCPALTIGDIVRDRAHEALSTPEDIPVDDIIAANNLSGEREQDLRKTVAAGDITGELIGNWVTYKLDRQEDAVAQWTVDEVAARDDHDHFAIDGVRTLADIAAFNDAFGEFTLVFVEVPFETRLNRLQDRGRGGEEGFTADDLRARDAREDDWGVAAIREQGLVDHVLENDGDLDDLEEEVDKLVTSRTVAP